MEAIEGFTRVMVLNDGRVREGRGEGVLREGGWWFLR